jgi:transposase
MPHPYAPPVVLKSEVATRLESLIRAGSTPQALAFRCRVVLRLADTDQPSNLQVANELGCSRNTVALWRDRYLKDGLAGLQDAPRSGRPRSFSPR